MPPERSTGCLETLLWETIKTDGIAECIEDYLECAQIPTLGNRRAEAGVYAYIAANREPGLKIGEAARAGFWNLDHPALLPVKRFVVALAA